MRQITLSRRERVRAKRAVRGALFAAQVFAGLALAERVPLILPTPSALGPSFSRREKGQIVR
jgi:hypothetical protein